jgi:hypothetical protein
MIAAIGGLGERHASTGISQEDLPEMQDRAPQGRGSGDLRRSAPQAASGLMRKHGARLGFWLMRDILIRFTFGA